MKQPNINMEKFTCKLDRIVKVVTWNAHICMSVVRLSHH